MNKQTKHKQIRTTQSDKPLRIGDFYSPNERWNDSVPLRPNAIPFFDVSHKWSDYKGKREKQMHARQQVECKNQAGTFQVQKYANVSNACLRTLHINRSPRRLWHSGLAAIAICLPRRSTVFYESILLLRRTHSGRSRVLHSQLSDFWWRIM